MRDHVMFELLYSSGLRVSELISLKLEDINLEAGFLRVLGKGSKERIVPVHMRAAERVKTYISLQRPDILKKKRSPYLFITTERRADDEAAFLADDKRSGQETRDRAFASYDEAFLCDTSARRRRGPPFVTEDARTLGYINNPDLYKGNG